MTIMPTLIHASSNFVFHKTEMSLKDTIIIPIEFWNLFKKNMIQWMPLYLMEYPCFQYE